MRASPFSLGPTRILSGGFASLAIPDPGVLRRYPTLIDPPTTQYPEITQAQPGYLEPVQFGGLDTVVVRVTDANNQFHHYSTWQAFSADQSTLLINTSSGGRLLDLSDWSLIRTFGIGAQVCFCDPVDPDLIWGHDGHGGGNGVYRYSIANNDNRRIAITGYTGISIGMGEGSMSADGRYMILCALKSGDSTPWVLVFDTSTETVVSTLNLTGWEYSGSSFDNAHISPSGNYVIVASYQSGSRGHRIYDRATLTYQRAYTGGSGTNASTGFPGHMDIGYRTNGDECMVRQRQDGALVSVRLSDGDERVEIPAAAMTWSNHISCRNIRRPGYAYISALYQGDQSSKYLFREVIAVILDGTGRIERFGQSVFPNNGNYATQAKATASPYGNKVLMTSGWGTTTPREYVMYVPEVMPLPYNENHFITQKGWAQTDGGNGGTIIAVTNLNASGAGSLKAALDASGKRTIVFEVSGVIDMAGAKWTVNNGQVTIAGQTAPSPGIALIKGMLEIATADVIVSHLFIGCGVDGGSGQDSAETVGGTNRAIFDHCAFFWGRDGNIDIAGYPWNGSDITQYRNNTSRNVTMTACVIAENFNSGGCLIHDNSTNIFLARNYFYAGRGRNGHFKSGTYAVSANNLIYNPQDKFFDYTLQISQWTSNGGGAWIDDADGRIDLIGNVCQAGPNTNANALFELVSEGDVDLYRSDNVAKRTNGNDYPQTVVSSLFGENSGAINSHETPRNTGHGEDFLPSGEVADWIMDNVGPRPWDRMAHVQRVLDHYDAGTGAHITNQSSVGGYPTLAENTKTFEAEDWDLDLMVPANEDALSGGEPAEEPVTPGAKLVGRGNVYSSGTAITTASGTTEVSGSSFLILVSWEDGPNIDSITDSKGNTYTLLGSVQNPSASPNAAQYLCANGIGGAGHTATVNFTGSNIYGVAHLIEIVGCTEDPLDKHVQGTDGTSPYTVATGSLAQADEVVVAFFAPQTSVNPTNHASSNTTVISREQDGDQYWASAVGTTVVSSTGSFTPSFTGSGLSGTAYMSVMTFKASS